MWGEMLPLHSNGLRMTVFDQAGDMLASNDFYSIVGIALSCSSAFRSDYLERR